MKIKNLKNFASGVLFTVIGLTFIIASLKFPMGTFSSMGPGLMPFVVGSIVALLGSLITIKAIYVK